VIEDTSLDIVSLFGAFIVRQINIHGDFFQTPTVRVLRKKYFQEN